MQHPFFSHVYRRHELLVLWFMLNSWLKSTLTLFVDKPGGGLTPWYHPVGCHFIHFGHQFTEVPPQKMRTLPPTHTHTNTPVLQMIQWNHCTVLTLSGRMVLLIWCMKRVRRKLQSCGNTKQKGSACCSSTTMRRPFCSVTLTNCRQCKATMALLPSDTRVMVLTVLIWRDWTVAWTVDIHCTSLNQSKTYESSKCKHNANEKLILQQQVITVEEPDGCSYGLKSEENECKTEQWKHQLWQQKGHKQFASYLHEFEQGKCRGAVVGKEKPKQRIDLQNPSLPVRKPRRPSSLAQRRSYSAQLLCFLESCWVRDSHNNNDDTHTWLHKAA